MRRGAVYPPTVVLCSKTISTSSASDRISSFLSTCEKSAYLHPDAMLEPSGIHLSRSSTGASGGIVMHHLKRIQQGLSGEILALDAEELLFTKGRVPKTEEPDQPFPKRWKSNVGPDGLPIKSALKSGLYSSQGVSSQIEDTRADGTRDADWVDRDENAKRHTVLDGVEYAERNGAPDAMQVDGPPTVETTNEKEARKLDKKARRKAEKRQKEESRKAG